jgi:hypothetical protein
MRGLVVLALAVAALGCGDGTDPADSDASVADGQPPPVLEVRREGAAVTDLRFGSLSVGSDAVLTVAVHNLSPAAVTVDAAVTSSSLRDWPAPCCLVA